MKKIVPIILLIIVFALFSLSCKKETKTPLPTGENTPTAEETTNTPKAEIKLSQTALSLSEGERSKLTASLVSADGDKKFEFISSSPETVYIDQNGNISAIKEGNAVITVKNSSGASAECTVTVTPRNDAIDKLILKYGSEIVWDEYYGDGIRLNENNEIVFSPILWDFNWDSTDKSVYQIYLRFTHIPTNDINHEFKFPSMLLDFTMSDQSHMDIVLQGNETDSGFCPIAGESYSIEYAIIHKFRKIVVYYGAFEELKVPKSINTSEYYSPSPMPGFMPKEENQFYLSYTTTEGGMIEGVQQQVHYAGDMGTSVTAKAKAGYKFVMWDDGLKTPDRADRTAIFDQKHTAYFVKEASEDMPIANMYIFTSTGFPIASKEYVNAQMMIVGASDPKYDINTTLQIKGRGNSSWNPSAPQDKYDSKNSYRIKLNEKEQLLGIGDSKNRDWILNSNKFDLSGLRNYLVWELADRMSTMPYVTDCQWVQLYVNAEYRGMYMLTERIEVANDRVEVDDTIESTDKGYLIEIDFRGTEEKQPYFYVTGYGSASNGNPREFVIKSACTEADRQYISKYIQQCHDAIVSGDRDAIDKLIDIPSFIDMYIIEELSKDVDVGAASFFMQKSPGGKVYFTAPWDFDFGFGTYGDAVTYDGMISIGQKGCTWYAALIEEEWFRKEVLDRMTELDDEFKDTLSAVRNKADELESSADQNAIFWNMYGNRFHGYVSSSVSFDLNSYDEHIDFLINWASARWDIMKNFFSTYTGYEEPSPELPEEI